MAASNMSDNCRISEVPFKHTFEIKNFIVPDLLRQSFLQSDIVQLCDDNLSMKIVVEKVPEDVKNLYNTLSDIFNIILYASVRKGEVCIVGTEFSVLATPNFTHSHGPLTTNTSWKRLSSDKFRNFHVAAKSKHQYWLHGKFYNSYCKLKEKLFDSDGDEEFEYLKLAVTVSGTVLVPVLGTEETAAVAEFEQLCLPNELSKIFLQESEYSDVKIGVNGKTFPVHKVILHARSKVFANLLQKTELDSNIITVNNFTENVVQEALYYIYTDKCPNIKNMAFELLEFSEQFNISGLKYLCETELKYLISIDNVCHIVDVADKCNAERLKTFCVQFIKRNMKSIVGKEKWKELKRINPELSSNIMEALLLDENVQDESL